ncbi:MAG TPA: HlyD family efflux transporter periplasmic adaptor subunit [Pseudorhizobium sp.]|nr:HlyD family efflux transporter periplasmic adaptor subunit [Pseudorhizobium sp.]
MRSLKIIAGLVLVVAALFVIIGEQLTGASANAFVNAQITTTRAPIAGQLRLLDRPVGARVSAGDPLGEISDPLVDNVRLADLLKEQAEVNAEADRMRSLLSSLDGSIKQLQDRSAAYTEERNRQLDAQADAAASLAEAAEARRRLAELGLARAERLASSGARTAEALEQAQSLAEVSALELRNVRQQNAIAQIALSAAGRGVFLGDGYNDQPYSQQRISELEVQRAELQASLAAQILLVDSLDARIAAERLRVNRLSSSSLQSNVNGLVWDYNARSGEIVQRGQDILRLVDCDSTIVTLSVSENVYNTLQLGTPATFRLNGDSRAFGGTVTRLAGSGTATVYENLAISPSERHLQRFDVALHVPALRENPDLKCLIGRTGRVFFEARPLDWLRGFWS